MGTWDTLIPGTPFEDRSFMVGRYFTITVLVISISLLIVVIFPLKEGRGLDAPLPLSKTLKRNPVNCRQLTEETSFIVVKYLIN